MIVCAVGDREGLTHAWCDVRQLGYQTNGQFCLECPEGRTCSRRGDVACQGQCEAGARSMCDLALGFANCETGACGPGTVANGVVYKGSYENPVQAGDCETYFRCNAGYYKWFSSFATAGCQPCAGKHALARYVTGGLSANDPRSCLWECDTSRQKTNWLSGACQFLSTLEAQPVHSSGWFGSEGAVAFMPGTCDPLYTTEANTALRKAECLACPELVPNGRAVGGARNCEWVCVAGLTRIGERCVLEYGTGMACDAAGWTKAGGDGKCVRSTVPWNRAGHRKTATRVLVSGVSSNWTHAVVVSSAGAAGLSASSTAGGVGGRHTVRVQDGGGVWRSATTEGPLCAMTRVWAGGKEYVVGAVCNQSFLAYLNISEVGASSSMPSRLGVLIGQPGTPGWADGFKTQARFGVELYVSSGLRNGTVWVLDRWNCVVREVVVWRTPGDYRTRVYTVHGLTDKFALVPPEAKCYGAGSLAEPRRFWEVSSSGGPSGVVLFSDDNGLWQLDLERGTLTAVMGEGWDLGQRLEADELVSVRMPDYFTLVLVFRDGTAWTVLASEGMCPDDWTSNAGGDCVVGCSWSGSGSYVNSTTGACIPCVVAGGCKAGQQWMRCTRSAQAKCVNCPTSIDTVTAEGLGRIYVTPGECDISRMRFTPPCPPNFYTTSDEVAVGGVVYCDMCPAEGLASTLQPGATRVEQCKCAAGLRRSNGMCVGEALYSYDDGACVSSPQQCLVPPRAALVLDWGDGFGRCLWECNAGYYHATVRAWADKCQPCARLGGETQMQAATRGDDDSPLSCEFSPAA